MQWGTEILVEIGIEIDTEVADEFREIFTQAPMVVLDTVEYVRAHASSPPVSIAFAHDGVSDRTRSGLPPWIVNAKNQ